jgi:hypothetical protein
MTKDEELTIVEMRALRDMLEQAKKDIHTLLEFYDCPRDFDYAMGELVKKIDEEIKPRWKGGTDVVQKNTAT